MAEIWLYSIGSVVVVSLVSLAGLIALAMSSDRLHKLVFVLVSLAIGALLGDAFIHLLPESYAAINDPLVVSYLVIGGFLLFFLLEKYLHWHHHHHEHAGVHIHPVGYINLIADGLHNLIDGVLISISFLASIPLGIATTVAVVVHEIPQEIGDFGVLIAAGFTRKRALLANFVTACMAILGAVLALFFAERIENLAGYILPITAGGFIYIAATDLLPEVQKETRPGRSALQLAAILVGIALMAALAYWE